MEKKPWPYWLKGAIIFGIIFLPALFIDGSSSILLIPFLFLWVFLGAGPVGLLFERLAEIFHLSDLTERILFLGFYVIFGALLGFLWGSLKKYKRTKQV